MEAKAMQPSPKVRVSAASSRIAEDPGGVIRMHAFPQSQAEPHQQEWLQKLVIAPSFFCTEALHLKVTDSPADDDDVMPVVV